MSPLTLMRGKPGTMQAKMTIDPFNSYQHCWKGISPGALTLVKAGSGLDRQCVVLVQGNHFIGAEGGTRAEQQLYPEALGAVHWDPICTHRHVEQKGHSRRASYFALLQHEPAGKICKSLTDAPQAER